MSAVSRPKSRLLLRRAIVWIAAYAFLLQTVLAPILMARVTSVDPDANQSLLILCSGHIPDIGGNDGIPSKAYDDCCKLCPSCGFGFVVGPHEAALTWAELSSSVGWATTENSVPDGTKFFGKRARGPPLLT